MTTHYDDEAQVEQLRRWWSENWISLAAGLVLGGAAIFGWQTFNGHREARRLAASQMFDELSQAIGASKQSDAETLAQALITGYDDTPYAADAQLVMAQNAMENTKPDDARNRLEWVRDHSKDPGEVDIARLRLARVLWQSGKPDDALAQLKGNEAEFDGQYAELRGDIELSRGNRDAARTAYTDAIAKVDADSPDHQQLQHKLDAVAPAAAAAAPAESHS